MANTKMIGKKDRLFGGETWTVIAIEEDEEVVEHFRLGQRIRLEELAGGVEMSTDDAPWSQTEGIPLSQGKNDDAAKRVPGNGHNGEPQRVFEFEIDIHGQRHRYWLKESGIALGKQITIRGEHEHGGTVHLEN